MVRQHGMRPMAPLPPASRCARRASAGRRGRMVVPGASWRDGSMVVSAPSSGAVTPGVAVVGVRNVGVADVGAGSAMTGTGTESVLQVPSVI